MRDYKLPGGIHLTTASSDTPQKKNKKTPEFIESIMDTFKQNGGLFTVFAVALIFVAGITIVDNPQNWWISVIALVVFFTTIFLFMNARVFLKVIFASLVTLLLSSFAFKIGSYIDSTGTGGLVWMCATLFLFFACLAFSYLVSSGKSRWGTMTIVQILAFSSTYLFSMGFGNVDLGTLTGVSFGILMFVFIYKLSSASRFSKTGMPENIISENLLKSFETGSAEANMNSVYLSNKNPETGSFLVWNDKAYLLHPVLLKSGFTGIGRKLNKLGYRDKNINPWLINLSFTETPAWRSRGANIMTVLVDLNNKNGSEPKVIGVTLPDTKRKLAVGVIPGKMFKSTNPVELQKCFEILEDEFDQFVNPLTDKQKRALSRIGQTEDVLEENSDTVDKDVSVNKG